MPIKTIKIYPQILSLTIDGNLVVSIEQEYHQNTSEIEKAVQDCIKTVRKYDKMGYYNLVKPEFISDVIKNFSNLELTKKAIIRVNNYLAITGFPECNRIWQLPNKMKLQISKMLDVYTLSFDTQNWESLHIEAIKSKKETTALDININNS